MKTLFLILKILFSLRRLSGLGEEPEICPLEAEE